jgi:hypothetical protein
MESTIKSSMQILMIFFLFAVSSNAAQWPDRASFYSVFSGKDYYGEGNNMSFDLSTMSNDGKVVAFYDYDFNSGGSLFIHDFESMDEPQKVILPNYVGAINTLTGLISNGDGTRIFFNASDTENSGHLFVMVNGKTGRVTILMRTTYEDVKRPLDIGTDDTGNYLYFNQDKEDKDGKRNLLRIAVQDGATPEVVIYAGSIPHPSGGTVKYIDEFDISNDGKTIVFRGLGWDNGDNYSRYDAELFVKTNSGIKNLTNNEEDDKESLVVSGDGSTIVYSEHNKWMVTTPTASPGDEKGIGEYYFDKGGQNKPGITYDGSIIFGYSCETATSSFCPQSLIRTDGTDQWIVEVDYQKISMAGDDNRWLLSDDGTRVFVRRSWNKWYTMAAGSFGKNLWPTQVPEISSITYPANIYGMLENSEQPEAKVTVYDPQENITSSDKIRALTFFPDGNEYPNSTPENDTATLYIGNSGTTDDQKNIFYRNIKEGPAWPNKTPVMTGRFSVEDSDFNFAYRDTPIKNTSSISPILYILLN